MPITIPPQVLPQIPHDSFWDNLALVIKLIGPWAALLLSLCVYVIKKIETNVENQSKALTAHTKCDDEVHDKLFTESRLQGERIAHIEGELGIKNHHPNPDSTRLP